MGKKTGNKKRSAARSASQKESGASPAATTSLLPSHVYDRRKLKIGDRVVLHSLQAEEFNGTLGTVQSVPFGTIHDTSRYGISVDNDNKDAPLPPIAIQAKNLVQVFAMGDRVFLQGLKNDKFNGASGLVVKLPYVLSDVDARYGIRLEVQRSDDRDNDNNHESNALAVRPHHLYLASRLSTEEQKRYRDEMVQSMERPPEKTATADQMGLMRQMMNMFLTEDQQTQIYGRKIYRMPDFRAEVFRQRGDGRNGGLPMGVDRTWAHDYLRVAFEQGSGCPHQFEMYFRRQEFEPSPSDVLKRVSSRDRDKLRWYFQATEPGDVNPHRRVTSYSSFFRHSFSNQTYRREKLHRGTTHVAVGFVDLGMLLTMDLGDQPTTTTHANSNSAAPLRFVGVEMSAYSVAKTHVVWELLQQTPPKQSSSSSSLSLQQQLEQRRKHLQSVLQLWFSTTWSKGTTTAVQNAVSQLLFCSKAKQESNAYTTKTPALSDKERHTFTRATPQGFHRDVQELLEHWYQAAPVSLESARAQKADATTASQSCIGYFLRQKDRLAMARYELSGDFGLGGLPPHCGNTIMLDCPDGTAPLEKDESIFSALGTREVMDVLKNNRQLSILEAAEEYALSQLEELADLIQKKCICMELICAKMEDVVDEIAAMRPWTMSWSNLVDYFDYHDFHRMARQCSIHGDTIHFGYSMNWSIEVFGTNILDFARHPSQTDVRAALIDKANESVQMTFSMFGWNDLLVCPPPTNPINTTSNFLLELGQVRHWADHFFAVAKRQGEPCQVANVEHATGRALFARTGSSTVYMTWTYDPEIAFKNLEELPLGGFLWQH